MNNRVLLTARVLNEGGPAAEQFLRDAGCELVSPEATIAGSEVSLIASLRGCHGTLCAPDPYTDAVFAASPDLRVVSRWGVGYDSIDVDAATRHGVVVTTTPGTLHDSVADLVFALMLASARNIPIADRVVRDGTWKYPTGVLVWGKTLGIIGLGTIGKAVARRAKGFDMEILAHDSQQDETFAGEHGVTYVSLDELLGRADFVTLHTTLSEETRGLIGEVELRRMKPEAFLINTGRGPLVDQDALVRALQNKEICGAGLDVFEEEPLPADNPLAALNNCVLTPHCGSFSVETIRKVSLVAARNIIDVLRGRRCPNALNPEVYDSPALRAPLTTA